MTIEIPMQKALHSAATKGGHVRQCLDRSEEGSTYKMKKRIQDIPFHGRIKPVCFITFRKLLRNQETIRYEALSLGNLVYIMHGTHPSNR